MVKHNKYNDTYQSSCIFCKEGGSWGRKQRLYYIPLKNYMVCHNCGWCGNTIKWVKEAGSLTIEEIQDELSEFKIDVNDYISRKEKEDIRSRDLKEIPTLPDDCINLMDQYQVNFHKKNRTVVEALKVIHDRRLDIAKYKPAALYVSLTDKTHKNRLIIPFYDQNNKIVFYQSRQLFNDDIKPRYISKVDGNKSLFNINLVDIDKEYVFLLEGPLNCFFLKNAIGVAGIQESSTKALTDVQAKQLNSLIGMKHIWVLDSQWIDRTAHLKTQLLIDQGESVFIWPEEFGKRFKDINDMTISYNLPEIGSEFILNHTYTGMKATLVLKKILTPKKIRDS